MKFPVLHIGQFPSDLQEMFYANDFQTHTKDHHNVISRAHKHDFYLTVMFTKGIGIHEVDFVEYDIKPGSTFMLNPGRVHHWKFSPDTEGYILFHTRNFYEMRFGEKSLDLFPFFFSLQNSFYLHLKNSDFLSSEKLFQQILEENRIGGMMKYQKISSMLDLLYVELTRTYLKQAPAFSFDVSKYQDRLKKLEELIDKHFRDSKSAAFYAIKMNMSTKHLNRITQAGLAKTTTELIMERVFLEAQRLLSYSAMSIAEVADNLGYDDISYFSRLFKKHLKISPSDFSKRYR
ncbi:helix-turn-helix domain-containing protein [Anditalea andensis]|uniref:HTH araC/xylS-type domain-containing protein n=1 Tax=Anditalea andensis TaxID=1048983 RepID=A0A074L5X7_9BACT|nr:AraC family transcriptional regulator [Anditalea andensis]KEO75233.1 hypothetical protein EL17_06125 [Anditalea andensis]